MTDRRHPWAGATATGHSSKQVLEGRASARPELLALPACPQVEKAVRLINENPAEARKHLVKNTFTPEDVVDTVPMIRYFMAKSLSDKDKADYQKFIDFSVETGTLEQKVDVTKYLQAF